MMFRLITHTHFNILLTVLKLLSYVSMNQTLLVKKFDRVLLQKKSIDRYPSQSRISAGSWQCINVLMSTDWVVTFV